MRHFLVKFLMFFCVISPAYSEWVYEKDPSNRRAFLDQKMKIQILKSMQNLGCYAYLDKPQPLTIEIREVLPFCFITDEWEDHFVRVDLEIPNNPISAVYWCHTSKGKGRDFVLPFYSYDAAKTGGTMPAPQIVFDVIYDVKKTYPGSAIANLLDSADQILHIRTLSNENDILISEMEVFSRQDIFDNGVKNCKPFLVDFKLLETDSGEYTHELSLRHVKGEWK